MTGQHEPLWKPEVKSGAQEPVMMSPMSYQGMKRTRDNNIIMAYRCHQPWWSLRHDKGVSNDGNEQNTF